MPIRAVIFDCFGVLCVGSLSRLYDMSGDRWQEVQDLSKALDRGMIYRSEFFEKVAPVVDMNIDELVKFVSNIHVTDDRMIEYVREVKKKYKTAVLSNIGDQTFDELFPKNEQRELFDEVVTSNSLGYCKPDVKIYQYTANKLGVLPEECLMVDDMDMNIDGAIQAGMQGVLFTDAKSGIANIRRLLDA